MEKGGTVNVSLSILENNTDLKNLEFIIVDPFTRVIEPKINLSKQLTLRFPYDFKSSDMPYENGNYSVILLSKIDNKRLISSYFNVVPFNPLLYSFGNFAFHGGLPITVGLIISIITTLYQIITNRNRDSNRRMEDKSQWMLENSKYFFELSYTSNEICNCFKKIGKTVDYKQFDSSLILYQMINFYDKYYNRLRQYTMYYFDDVLSEDFVLRLTTKIFDVYEEIIGESKENLVKFTGKKYDKLICQPDFKEYIQKLCNKANSNTKIFERLYKYQFLYYHIMNVVVNDSLLITYSSPKLLEEDIRYGVEEVYDTLKPILDDLNKSFYGADEQAKKLYYYFKFNNRNLIRKH
jgi:hypothetical protein